MSRLSEQLRKRMIHLLAREQAESYADFDTGDFYDLLVDGLPGLNDYTDKELVEEYHSHFDCVLSDGIGEYSKRLDPQVKAMRDLQFTLSDPVQKKEVQGYIDQRIQVLGGNEWVDSAPDALTVSIFDIWAQIKKEMGL